MAEDNDIEDINIEMIRDLKSQGQIWEANRLLKKFRRSKKEAKKQLKKDIDKRDRIIKAHYGFCTTPFCFNDAIPGKKKCARHTEAHKKYYAKHGN